MSDKPKRPLSAYMIWLNSARDQIKRENPGIKVTEVAKKGGELWRAMKDKSEWEAKAAQAKENYEDAVREFEANGGSTANGTTKKRGKAAKKPAKKSKKQESEDEDDEEDEESD
ncbi:high mobility group protein D [Zeugodacus cucurbitae]|uniref:Mobility group protein 1A n=2 Tax=Zeugodacus cucurbitae TaxID=28588 RepID=A0A0A1XQ51_ZEUCU|nr:high mobility group protein D [Zeugodacus cucurbitae]XP_011185458.1 high mobility group protein D [Zeugodacus cucurbitae]XP_028897322.1 high mobility group protein D [Zeugodacus cucurbitae]